MPGLAAGAVFGCNGNRNVFSLFEFHIIAVFVNQSIFDSEISLQAGRPGDGDLCLFR
jgi:hypothetical protein